MALRLRIVADDSAVLKSISTVTSKAGGLSRGLAGMSSAGKAGFGGIAAAMTASGLPGQFSSLQSLLGNAAQGFDQLGGKKINLGHIVTGSGVLLSALAGIGLALGDPLEAARAQLDQSIKNAHGSVAAFAAPIGNEEKKMQSLGFTYTDTDSALSKLTQGFGSTKKALSETSLVANLAARNHSTLAQAADLVNKAYAKSPMVLKQFGINTSDITKKGTAAVAAQKASAKAVQDLAKKQQALSQLQERLGAKSTSTGAASAASITAAHNAVAAAGAHQSEVQAKISAGSLTGASAAAQLQAAQDRVSTAMARLDAAQSKTGKTTGLTIAQQQQLSNAQAAVSAAQTAVSTTGATAAATQGDMNDANLTGQKILDMLAKKTQGLAQAQANTFGGKLRAYKTDVEDFGATYGAKFGKVLMVSGPALAGVGTIIESGFFGKIGSGIGKLGGWGAKLLGFGGTAATMGDEATTAGTGVGTLGSAAETATGKVAGVGMASQGASPFTTTLGSTAAISGTEVEGLGAASLGATPEVAGLGDAAAVTAGEEDLMGKGGKSGLKGLLSKLTGGAGGAKGLLGGLGGKAALGAGAAEGATVAEGGVAAEGAAGAGALALPVAAAAAAAAAGWFGGHALNKLSGGAGFGGTSFGKLAQQGVSGATEAAKKGNYGELIKNVKVLESLNAAQKRTGIGTQIQIPAAWKAFVANAATAKIKDPTLGKVASASTATAAAIKGLQAKQTGLLNVGTAAATQTAIGKLTTVMNAQFASGNKAGGNATLTELKGLQGHLQDLATVSAHIATDQHTMSGLKSVEKAIVSHPVVAHYDQSVHNTIVNPKIMTSDPDAFYKQLIANSTRSNRSGEGSPTSSSGG